MYASMSAESVGRATHIRREWPDTRVAVAYVWMSMSSTNKKARISIALVVALVALATIGSVAAMELWSDEHTTVVTLLLALVVGTGVLIAYVAWSVSVDLTASDRARETLERSEARVTGLVTIAADAIISIDAQYRIVLFNHGAETIFGWRAAEVMHQPISVLLPERFRSSHGQLIGGFAKGAASSRRMGERREISGIRRNGEEFPADASILKLDVAGEQTFTVVLRDITERKRIEDEQRFLADAGRDLTRTLEDDETLDAVARLAVARLGDACLVDVLRDGAIRRVTSVSDSPAVAAALAALRLDAPGPDSASAIVDVLRTGKAQVIDEVNDEWLESHSETEDVLARWRALAPRSLLLVPLQARDEVMGVMTVIALGSHRYSAADLDLATRMAERAAFAIDNARLLGVARNATKARDDMLGVVSHDLRNSVHAIGMCARVLRESPPDDPAARLDLVNAISDAFDVTERLIRDLLDVAAIDAGRLSMEQHPEEVRAIVDSALAMLAHAARERGVALLVEYGDDLPLVEGDSARLVQVISNIVSNAIGHTMAGGQVRVSVHEEDGGVLLAVADTGTGISPEELPHVFERHWRSPNTVRKGGLGLGLAIASGIVQAHGGRVWVESRVGEGATFYVTLPGAGSLA